MARKAGSVPAVPTTATGEMHSFLQAVRQSLLRAEELLNITEAALESQIAAASDDLTADATALAARVTTAEGEIDTLQSQMTTANTNIGNNTYNISVRALQTQTIAIPIYIEFPTVNEHLFFIDSPYAITITKVTARLSGGTATIAIQPNNVAMNTGAMAVTTTQGSESPTSSNTIAVGGDLYLDISAVSATASELKIMVYGTIVLA